MHIREFITILGTIIGLFLTVFIANLLSQVTSYLKTKLKTHETFAWAEFYNYIINQIDEIIKDAVLFTYQTYTSSIKNNGEKLSPEQQEKAKELAVSYVKEKIPTTMVGMYSTIAGGVNLDQYIRDKIETVLVELKNKGEVL